MINIWGICEYGGIFTTQMVRYDASCTFFNPKTCEKTPSTERCCANCMYWITSDELLMEREK